MTKTGLWYVQDRTWIGLHQDLDTDQIRIPEDENPEENIPGDNIPEDNIPEDNIQEDNIPEEITLDITSMALSAKLVTLFQTRYPLP